MIKEKRNLTKTIVNVGLLSMTIGGVVGPVVMAVAPHFMTEGVIQTVQAEENKLMTEAEALKITLPKGKVQNLWIDFDTKMEIKPNTITDSFELSGDTPEGYIFKSGRTEGTDRKIVYYEKVRKIDELPKINEAKLLTEDEVNALNVPEGKVMIVYLDKATKKEFQLREIVDKPTGTNKLDIKQNINDYKLELTNPNQDGTKVLNYYNKKNSPTVVEPSYKDFIRPQDHSTPKQSGPTKDEPTTTSSFKVDDKGNTNSSEPKTEPSKEPAKGQKEPSQTGETKDTPKTTEAPKTSAQAINTGASAGVMLVPALSILGLGGLGLAKLKRKK